MSRSSPPFPASVTVWKRALVRWVLAILRGPQRFRVLLVSLCSEGRTQTQMTATESIDGATHQGGQSWQRQEKLVPGLFRGSKTLKGQHLNSGFLASRAAVCGDLLRPLETNTLKKWQGVGTEVHTQTYMCCKQ